ncbi:MAG: hypothetical protein HIU82_01945 [Proteobacteria bacterium]|nr:hypothetical protein [Pseudomonadota bacterium]
MRVEIHGELASILALAEGARCDKGAGDTGALCEQIKMVAGTGFNLSRTRFQAAQIMNQRPSGSFSPNSARRQ